MQHSIGVSHSCNTSRNQALYSTCLPHQPRIKAVNTAVQKCMHADCSQHTRKSLSSSRQAMPAAAPGTQLPTAVVLPAKPGSTRAHTRSISSPRQLQCDTHNRSTGNHTASPSETIRNHQTVRSVVVVVPAAAVLTGWGCHALPGLAIVIAPAPGSGCCGA